MALPCHCKVLWSMCILDSLWLLAVSSGQQQYAEWQNDSVSLEVASTQCCAIYSSLSAASRSRWMFSPFLHSCSVLGKPPCRMHECCCIFLSKPLQGSQLIQGYAFMTQPIGWEGCFKSLCSFKRNTQVKQSAYHKTKPFASFPCAYQTLNNILLSKLGQIPAHLGDKKPRGNLLTQNVLFYAEICLCGCVSYSNVIMAGAAEAFYGLVFPLFPTKTVFNVSMMLNVYISFSLWSNCTMFASSIYCLL